MLSRKRKAAHLAQQAARTNNQQNISYQDSVSVSREKLQIGTLLLALQSPLGHKQQKICWTLFEAKLRHYVDLKIGGGMI